MMAVLNALVGSFNQADTAQDRTVHLGIASSCASILSRIPRDEALQCTPIWNTVKQLSVCAHLYLRAIQDTQIEPQT